MIRTFRLMFVQLILSTGLGHVLFPDWIRYISKSMIRIMPVALILKVSRVWFSNNEQFSVFIMIALLINVLVGAIRHFKTGTFSVKRLIIKNCELTFVVIVVYILMEMLTLTAGDNIVGDIFETFIQVMTLLYPISKSAKNIFILTKGKYPPEIIMRKLYNFEKNGDLGKLFSTKTEKNEDGFLEYKEKLKRYER